MESTSGTIRISEIRTIVNAALAVLEARGIQEISLETDAYWSIYFQDSFNFEQEPQPVVGSLSDDISDLRSEMNGLASDEGIALWHIFHHLEGLIKLMAEESRIRSL